MSENKHSRLEDSITQIQYKALSGLTEQGLQQCTLPIIPYIEILHILKPSFSFHRIIMQLFIVNKKKKTHKQETQIPTTKIQCLADRALQA